LFSFTKDCPFGLLWGQDGPKFPNLLFNPNFQACSKVLEILDSSPSSDLFQIKFSNQLSNKVAEIEPKGNSTQEIVPYTLTFFKQLGE
jgi:hypothetical protein